MPIIVAIAVSVLGLLASYLIKEPCTSHGWANFFQYRHLCYNDIQPLFYARHVNTGAVPYRDVQVEYPVIIGSFMYAAGRFLSLLVHWGVAHNYSDPQYFTLTAFLLAPLSLAITLLLRPRVRSDRLLLWAIGTPTLLYSFLNWDLLAAVCLVAGLVAGERRRWGWAGIALALGTSAKLYPGFVAPSMLLAVWALKDVKGSIRFLAGFGAAAAAVNVPWMLVSWKGWLGVWQFHAARYPDFGTIWYWIARFGYNMNQNPWWNQSKGGYEAFLGNAGLAAFGLITLVILWLGWQRRREAHGYPVAATGLAIIAMFMVVSKVNSPQYALWILPLVVMLDIPWWLIGTYLVADLTLFVSGFWWFTENEAGATGWAHLFTIAVFLRAACLVGFALLAMKQGHRQFPARSAPGPEPAGPAAEPELVPLG